VSLAFHRNIGSERKAARLRYLRNRWAKPLLAVSPRVKIWTPIDDDAASCGITLVNIDGIEPGKLATYLMDRYGIHVISIGHKDFQGIRVTPNIYATLEEIDTFGEAMQRAVEKGIS
jgi:selenocysteine lyase/cysteine desulfurase